MPKDRAWTVLLALAAILLPPVVTPATAANSAEPPKPLERAAEPPAPARAGYLLKEGDALEVSVWHEDALRKELRVLPDGSVSFPLVGRVEVAGLSLAEVEAIMTERLKPYLADPVVTVVIGGINGNRFYIIGKVNKPGPVVLDAPTTILQALSLAGGLDRFADEDAIKVLRPKLNGVDILPVRYNDLIKARDLSTNVQLRAGDTILVP
ncbi:MAG: polysaccharide biosynthesis/export family protein [Pseudomonadota bacterium]